MLLAESGLLVGVLLPGASLLVALGVLAQLGLVTLAAALSTALVATLLGTHLRFLSTIRSSGGPGSDVGLGPGSGRRRAAGLHDRLRRLANGRISLAPESAWERRPGTLVLLGHLIGGVRTLIPRIAAARGMGYPRFAAANLASGVGWVSLFVMAGYGLAGSADEISTAAAFLGAPLVVVVLVGRWAVNGHVRRRSLAAVRSETR